MKRASRTKRPTMKDVASQSGVSVSTVSHVVNSSRYVDPHTRDKIEKVIEELDYRPNIVAQSLRSKRSRFIGIVVPNIRETFFTELIKSIESKASRDGLSVILCDSEDNLSKELNYLDTLIQKGVEAIVLCPTSDDAAHYKHLNLEELVVVQVDRKISGLNLDFVGIDSAHDIQLTVEHLVDNKARSIAFIGYKVDIGPLTTINYSVAQLVEAFSKTVQAVAKGMQSHVLMPKYKYAPLVEMRQQRVDEISLWLYAHPEVDAVICGNQTVCHEVLLGAIKAERKIPDDLLLVSLGDNQWLPLLATPITATQHPVEQISSLTLRLIQEELKGRSDEKKRVKQQTYRSELVVRASSRLLTRVQ